MNNFHSLNALLKAASIDLPAQEERQVTHLTQDSRQVRKGSLFFALKGSKGDGSRFIEQAIRQDASAIITSRQDAVSYDNPTHIPIIEVADPRYVMGRVASCFFGPQPKRQIAITGTNGKSSTSYFIQQFYSLMGLKAACIGTLGIIGPDGQQPTTHTTPDAITLARILSGLKEDGIEHVALEASSHGLAQERLASAHLTGGGFTSFSRDHLDYHGDLAHYREAKLKLFNELLPPNAIIAASDTLDEQTLSLLQSIAQKRALRLRIVGSTPRATIQIRKRRPLPYGQNLTIILPHGGTYVTHLPLIGGFQADNALIALALCYENTDDIFKNLHLLSQLRTVPGRLEQVTNKTRSKIAYIDYAHTPDALQTVLSAVKQHCAGRLIVVFGAGGERDMGKRPLMGQAVARYADVAIITDDNPRSEDPQTIRAAIAKAIPQARNIGDRKKAIETAVKAMKDGDVLVVAGKGHEKYQMTAQGKRPFDDVQITKAFLSQQ